MNILSTGLSPDESQPLQYASSVRAHSLRIWKHTMNIDIKDIPSPSKLITTMDEHPVGAVLFVVALMILFVGVAGCMWLYFMHRVA